MLSSLIMCENICSCLFYKYQEAWVVKLGKNVGAKLEVYYSYKVLYFVFLHKLGSHIVILEHFYEFRQKYRFIFSFSILKLSLSAKLSFIYSVHSSISILFKQILPQF